jgi:ABC-2 type transport system ATP-binding protein
VSELAGDAVVVTRGLSKSYRTGHIIQGRRPALVDLDLEVRRGEILGYVGPNGSGKTTTLKLLTGLLHPDRGEALVLGQPLAARARPGSSAHASCSRWSGSSARPRSRCGVSRRACCSARGSRRR